MNASHILIKTNPDANPEDTLIAYEKVMKISDRFLTGESFEMIARGTSDDPSVKSNGGSLGYFTVFQMVYPFETGAYNTAVGEISDPVRSDFGYHIIKVTDRIPALGSMEVAHLFIQMPENATLQDSTYVEEKADILISDISGNII